MSAKSAREQQGIIADMMKNNMGMSDQIANISSLFIEPYLESIIPPKTKHPKV